MKLGSVIFRSMREQGKMEQNSFIVKHFNKSAAQHFHQIKMITWNALPCKVVGTVNLLKNSLEKHWEENFPDVTINW